MKLYIKQKVFSWRSRFTVTDENGGVRYMVAGELLTFARKLHVTDGAGKEWLFIREKLWTFLSRYELWTEGAYAATIRRDFTLFRPHYTFEGSGLTITDGVLSADGIAPAATQAALESNAELADVITAFNGLLAALKTAGIVANA